ncbi:hypothetical protein B0H63DRAFT_534039 [Podospora didyma]|uniref:Uncharacterized protein n=1 Tax=Podospora didyma TaxID=330526 RepID=A0AAE0P8K4_9PEZI|nr:hypothetical protein B0H63DRAFT_534039 [Podospora didyma]
MQITNPISLSVLGLASLSLAAPSTVAARNGAITLPAGVSYLYPSTLRRHYHPRDVQKDRRHSRQAMPDLLQTGTMDAANGSRKVDLFAILAPPPACKSTWGPGNGRDQNLWRKSVAPGSQGSWDWTGSSYLTVPIPCDYLKPD